MPSRSLRSARGAKCLVPAPVTITRGSPRALAKAGEQIEELLSHRRVEGVCEPRPVQGHEQQPVRAPLDEKVDGISRHPVLPCRVDREKARPLLTEGRGTHPAEGWPDAGRTRASGRPAPYRGRAHPAPCRARGSGMGEQLGDALDRRAGDPGTIRGPRSSRRRFSSQTRVRAAGSNRPGSRHAGRCGQSAPREPYWPGFPRWIASLMTFLGDFAIKINAIPSSRQVKPVSPWRVTQESSLCGSISTAA